MTSSDSPDRVLAVVPVDADPNAVRDAVAGADEVLVVVPAAPRSAIARVVSDVDDAISEADAEERAVVRALRDDGIDADGETGEIEAELAIEDALRTFPATRILVCATGGDDPGFERLDIDSVRVRVDVPVETCVVPER